MARGAPEIRDACVRANDRVIHEHRNICRALHLSMCYDQLQGGELAALELLARRAQLVELKYRDRVIKLSAEGNVEDDEHLYMGTGMTRGKQRYGLVGSSIGIRKRKRAL